MSKQTLVMLVGLPASGKSTITKNFDDSFVIFSTDEYRKQKYGDASIQEPARGPFFQEFHNLLFAEWRKGSNIIYDATNLSFKRRRAFLRELARMTPSTVDYTTKCYLIICPYDECLKRNSERARNVPESVMEKMFKTFQTPSFTEGWDEIIIHHTGAQPLSLEVGQSRYFDQDSPHHRYNLLTHCYLTSSLACHLYAEEMINRFETIEKTQDASYWASKIIQPAGLYHDIGKRQAQVYYNKKGEPTKEAHYYGHESIGAYLWLCDISKMEAMGETKFLMVALLIQYHLVPQNLKTKEEVIEWGNSRGADGLMLWCLHQADRQAH